MKGKHHTKIAKLILVITAVLIVIATICLSIGSKFISSQLLTANENMAVDIALLVKNNFHITDAEVRYMKSLSFNEMETDAINHRLMNVGNGVKLNTKITNVYIVAPLNENEIKYQPDQKTAEFFGYDVNTKLDGIWLLNGKIDEKGHFVEAKREDIYRYTNLTQSQEQAMKDRKPFGELSEDAWGKFITGYTPVYTVEGNFVGLLGIDMAPDRYQSSAQNMIAMLLMAFAMVSLVAVGLFLYFYYQYIKAKEGQLYFDFYSRMSHDMRTPMNGILGLATLSKDEDSADVLHHNFELVEESGKYMLGLINDTLDVQKLDAGRLKLDPKIKRCGDVIQSIVEMIQTEARQNKIHLEVTNHGVPLDCYSYIDEMRVQQIFMNLASNAVKFTPEGGTIRLNMDCLEKDGGVYHAKFQVADSGIGMSENFIRTRLFKPFEQEQDSVTTQYGGSGLGLSIVKNLVDLMYGRMEVESELGKGSTFTVYLDIEEVDCAVAKQELEQMNPLQKQSFDTLEGKRALLCEDHSLNAMIASKLLEMEGMIVEVAENGKIGVDMFAASDIGYYDVVLMDIRMPVMDGIKATKTIRKLARDDASLVPIIAMTANAFDEDKEQCMQAGMNGHIVKPIQKEVLYHTLEQVLM